MPLIDKYFPESNLLNKIQELKDKESKRKSNSAKFNGFIAAEITGKSGKDLGMLINGFKKAVESFCDSYDDYIADSTSDAIKSKFIQWVDSEKSI